MRKVIIVRGKYYHITLSEAAFEAINEWRRKQIDIPTFSESINRLIVKAIKGEAELEQFLNSQNEESAADSTIVEDDE